MLSLKDLNTQFITDDLGKKTAVIIPISDFDNLMRDLKDLAIVAERRDEETISHEDLKKELNLT